MRLTRRIKIQLTVFTIIAVVFGAIVAFGYMRVQNTFLGISRYSVKLELSQTGNLYRDANVTYRGVEVGRVQDVHLTNTGAEAVLQLQSGVAIPADLNAEVHSVSAVGEQYVALLPRSGKGPSLKDGDVIPQDRTSVPPEVNSLLEAANRGLSAIPRDSLKTTVDEAYTAVGGLGPELSRLVSGGAALASDARNNLDSITTLIDQSKPLLDSQTDSGDSIQAWASHLANVTKQLQTNDSAVADLIQKGPAAAEEVRQLIDRLDPTLPTVLANLVSVGQVAVTYRADLEAILVLLPSAVADLQATEIANRNTKQDYKGIYLSFNLNLNTPPPCTTGFFPVQQQRSPTFQDYPDRPKGNVYCRIPQDSNLTAARGARNYPCETRPGRRAATVKMCESDAPYIPLNDGFNWKGDPNATLTGQGIPQFDPGELPPPQPPATAPHTSPSPASGAPGPPSLASATAGQPTSQAPTPPPLIAVEYDPATGTYVGPDGVVQRRGDLAANGKKQTWQQMLIPAPGE
jgi:phospholipid/cholesterol/gamma-HCH transport system substrate-binding protein